MVYADTNAPPSRYLTGIGVGLSLKRQDRRTPRTVAPMLPINPMTAATIVVLWSPLNADTIEVAKNANITTTHMINTATMAATTKRYDKGPELS
jgi:hypothetical protein